jgi:DNA-binding CsgD family transcriptional regulator/tetratricopeptide (TPR) repeat protein
MALRAMSPVLIGRTRELDRLLQALGVAWAQGSAVALVAGEAGVGKTRLVHELSARAVDQGWRVCVGRCVDLGEAIWPLAPLREMVGGLVDDLDDEALDLVLGGARGVLARLVPDLGDAASGDDPLTSDRLCELVVGLFSRLARRAPLVLVVEDLHWADGSTRLLFSVLARVGRLRPVLLVGTFRSDEVGRRHPLRTVLAEIERTGRCDRIDVQPLDQSATAEFVGAIDATAGRQFVDDVHRRSGGNPFYVEELIAARASGLVGLPDTLRDVLLARASAFDDTDLAILGVAAAAGATTPDVLADVAGVDSGRVRAALERLFNGALLVPDGDEVRFRHELGREVFEDELMPGERAQVHARLATSLQSRRPDRMGEIARHWSAANDASRALGASVAAGRQALAAGAAAEAETHLARALDLWDAVDDAAHLAGIDHAGLLTTTATAAFYAGHLDHAVEMNHLAAEELAGVDPIRAAEAWLQLGHQYRYTHRWDDGAAATARAMALIPETPPSSQRVDALCSTVLSDIAVTRDPAAALAHARQAVAAANALDDHDAIVMAHIELVTAMDYNGDYEGALDVALANLARCDRSTSTERTIASYSRVIQELFALDRLAEVPRYTEPAVNMARETGLAGPRGAWMALSWIESLILLGHWSEAEDLVDQLADLVDHPTQQGDLGLLWGVVLIRQGRLDEARPLIEEARNWLRRRLWNESVANMAAAVALFDAANGCLDQAESLVEDVVADERPCFVGNSFLIATAIAWLGDRLVVQPGGPRAADQRAITTAERWIRWMRTLEQDALRSSRVEQLYGDLARAEFTRLQGQSDAAIWEELAAAWQRLGVRYEEAYARFRHVEALLAGTPAHVALRRRAANDILTVAFTIAQELEAAPLLTRIQQLARRARLPVTPASSPPSEEDHDQLGDDLGLTSREREVLTLLARGYSNGQIASELFISTKTASVHVSNLIRKLQVTNRIEAAAFAERLRDR